MGEHRDDSHKTTRRTYEAPRIVEEQQFETLALSCAKTVGAQCQAEGGTTNS